MDDLDTLGHLRCFQVSPFRQVNPPQAGYLLEVGLDRVLELLTVTSVPTVKIQTWDHPNMGVLTWRESQPAFPPWCHSCKPFHPVFIPLRQTREERTNVCLLLRIMLPFSTCKPLATQVRDDEEGLAWNTIFLGFFCPLTKMVVLVTICVSN